MLLCPDAALCGGSHGKVWIRDGNGDYLSEIQHSGKREERRTRAWAEALKNLEEGTKAYA